MRNRERDDYFPKKEHVLLHVGSSYNGLLTEMVRKHREGHLKDRLMDLFRDFLSLYLGFHRLSVDTQGGVHGCVTARKDNSRNKG
ncbi:hypothetical protein [Cohnella zeiphila]|uniref:hypothetical protein n=1 Tax=Cohnella zeiphila TaxID=2761120 RepID=UPI003B585D0F